WSGARAHPCRGPPRPLPRLARYAGSRHLFWLAHDQLGRMCITPDGVVSRAGSGSEGPLGISVSSVPDQIACTEVGNTRRRPQQARKNVVASTGQVSTRVVVTRSM